MRVLALISYIVISIYIGYCGNDAVYFLGAQIGEVILFGLIIDLLDSTTLRDKRICKALASGAFILSTFELIDEVRGINTAPNVNDFVGLLLGLSSIIYLLIQWKILKKN